MQAVYQVPAIQLVTRLFLAITIPFVGAYQMDKHRYIWRVLFGECHLASADTECVLLSGEKNSPGIGPAVVRVYLCLARCDELYLLASALDFLF